MRHDVAIVGAGMAGASLAAALAPHLRVVLIEAEERPGYHATGRSAAFWQETYGGPDVQPLTAASGAWLEREGFLSPRGALYIARFGEEARLDALREEFAANGVLLEERDRAELDAAVPGLRGHWVAGLAEPSCRDIDVAGLHALYLRAAARDGAELRCDSLLLSARRDGGVWRIETRSGPIEADRLVNAAGAWADEVASLAGVRPIGIAPLRRTMVPLLVDPPAAATMPLVEEIGGSFYFKPEAGGRIWLSPHDESPSPPCDAAPEELDVAIAIDRLEQAVDWRIVRHERPWAGLRSFAPDRIPVYGPDPVVPGFFWFAGQGGFGIQTAPAAAQIGAALLLGGTLPESVRSIDAARYAPDRFGG
ncbi:NAD(P)/FAD-dependent oxidoreductase [Flavisphingomonas formosensis]|uniref:NAD(P)/FAD-dependent oxidoreductase n=1 Tax=Flavisphingomonas formosensis TaxID=861534 RepID=UPI0012FCE644|nr:FAD-dependent oxidoreductase [Sphingomonas formosensis]